MAGGMSVAVITATRCQDELADAINSVAGQTYKNIKHYVVGDGAVSEATFQLCALANQLPNQYWIYWPTAIKRPLINASRIYAAVPSLINEDIIILLNEDDWFAPNHVETLVGALEKNHWDWAFSHRNIYDKEGNFLCEDKCESLGEDHDVWNLPGHRFVETCSIAMRTDCFVTCAPVFNWPSAVNDRVFYDHAKQLYPNFGGTKLPTMCFRLGGNPHSVTIDYFKQGNAAMKAKYGDIMPWETSPSKTSSKQPQMRSILRRQQSTGTANKRTSSKRGS